MEDFTKEVIMAINSIPRGKVSSYGRIAIIAGRNTSSARQVARFLSSMSKKYNLPWYRVVNGSGKITSPSAEKQKLLLEIEGVEVINFVVSKEHWWP